MNVGLMIMETHHVRMVECASTLWRITCVLALAIFMAKIVKKKVANFDKEIDQYVHYHLNMQLRQLKL